jgi:transposase-like protein
MEVKQRDRQRERFWRDAMAAWQASGLSVRQYCRRHGLAEPSFYHWRHELQQRDARPTAAAPPAFVPVTVVPAAAVEVRCPTGHVVTLPAADAATLRAVFAALAPEASC